MSEHEEQVISTASEPVVEIVEEILPDGSVVRKKKTTRTITKRVLSTTSSPQEILETSTTRTVSSSSVSSTTVHDSESHDHHHHSIEASKEAMEVTVDTKTEEEAEEAEVSEEKLESSASPTTATTTTTTTTTTTNRSIRSTLFGEGGLENHPFFRFLARFPLKQLPAPHTRPSPVRPVLYAFVPGWKIGQQQDGDAKTSQPAIGSFDVDSLKWMAYLKFNKIEFDIRPAFEPNMSPSGTLPFLALPNGSLITTEGFESFIQENKAEDAAAKLSFDEATEAVAFINLAESKVHSALVYTLWFEAAHFQTTTRQHYFGHHKPLLTMILAYLEKSRIVSSMLLTRSQIDREQIFEEAVAAIDALAVQLGDKDEYFFGKDKPSSLDAVVFAYLHVILTTPRIRNVEDAGRSGELARIVRKHENLFRYSQNIWNKWFSA
ncbi:hypothetical protein BGZ51_006046 [Haplosporangium sp. Z 767]|nr:hypothetical protein BGZ51_006046 [Haplosporangium sp. Z 767]